MHSAITPSSSTGVRWSDRTWFWLIIGTALILRLVFVILIDPTPHMAGGDGPWLLATGLRLVNQTATEPPSSGPLYLVFAGVVQGIVGTAAAPQTIRILNAFFGAIVVGCVMVIGRRYLSERIARVAAIIIAVNPMFIIESGTVLTESLFLPLLFGGLALYTVYEHKRAAKEKNHAMRWLFGVGVLLGLATLTRAVTLAFPFALVIHLIYVERRRAVRPVVLLLATYLITVSLWSAYTLLRWNRFVFGADGIAANIYLGATGSWCGPSCVDARAGITGSGGDNQSKFVQGAVSSITSDPVGYVRTRVQNLMEALLQPHNTVYYPGESLKSLAVEWWGQGHSLAGLSRIINGDAFWPKLVLYIFHYIALLGGLFGMIIGLRRRFWALFPLYAFVGYFLAVHAILTAIPRYMFPIEAVLWLFVGFAFIRPMPAVSEN